MKDLQQLIDALDPEGTLVTVHGDASGVSIDAMALRSDKATAGTLFCCVPGGSSDGHDWAADAVARGASALLVQRPVELEQAVPQLQVANVRSSMGPLAALLHGDPTSKLEVYGITGTNGKTTTTLLLRAILETAGQQTGVVGTVGARIGGVAREDLGFTTPEAVDLQALFAEMVAAGDAAATIEVSSHALDQGRVKGTQFRAVGFSNLTRDHLDYHKSFEAYYIAKRRLFIEPQPDGSFPPAAINCDDEWGVRMFDELVHAEREDVPVWGFTLDGMNRASVSAAEFTLHAGGATIELETPVGDMVIESKLRGKFNVENVLCAVTLALLTGIDPAHVKAGIESVDGIRGRFEPIEGSGDFGVYVDYAHTPDSLEQVLQSAREFAEGRVIVVFGCGGDRDRTKRPMMGRVAAQIADVVFVTSDNPRSEDPAAIIAEIRKGMRGKADVREVAERRDAIRGAIAEAAAGDVVIIAGKGHEQGQVFADETVPFDDAGEAREALAREAKPSQTPA